MRHYTAAVLLLPAVQAFNTGSFFFLRSPPQLHRNRVSLSSSPAATTDASTAPATNANEGYTAGAALLLKDVDVGVGDNTLISGLDWSILPNERWAIVGTNGCGKSTLLKAITGTGGELGVMQKGTVSVMPGTRLGFLEQTAVSGATSTVKDVVMSRMVEYQTALAEVEAAEAGCTEGSESELERLDAACKLRLYPTHEPDQA